jgi:hypothetical protein
MDVCGVGDESFDVKEKQVRKENFDGIKIN